MTTKKTIAMINDDENDDDDDDDDGDGDDGDDDDYDDDYYDDGDNDDDADADDGDDYDDDYYDDDGDNDDDADADDDDDDADADADDDDDDADADDDDGNDDDNSDDMIMLTWERFPCLCETSVRTDLVRQRLGDRGLTGTIPTCRKQKDTQLILELRQHRQDHPKNKMVMLTTTIILILTIAIVIGNDNDDDSVYYLQKFSAPINSVELDVEKGSRRVGQQWDTPLTFSCPLHCPLKSTILYHPFSWRIPADNGARSTDAKPITWSVPVADALATSTCWSAAAVTAVTYIVLGYGYYTK